MKCISPYIKYLKERPITGEATQPVPCGKCVVCLKRRANGWVFRLKQEQKISTSTSFITLTYHTVPSSPTGLPTLVKSDWQKFMKRLRSYKGRKFPNLPKLKYYACGEYGKNLYRPHYHAIIFNLPPTMVQNHIIESIWNLGFTDIQPAEDGAIRYVSHYVNKRTFTQSEIILDDDTGEIYKDDRIPEFSLQSQGLGLNFLTSAMKKYIKENLKTSVLLDGYQVAIPRYFKDKNELLTKEDLKNMSESANWIHQFNYEKLFNSDPHREHEYKKQLLNKQKIDYKLTRVKL